MMLWDWEDKEYYYEVVWDGTDELLPPRLTKPSDLWQSKPDLPTNRTDYVKQRERLVAREQRRSRGTQARNKAKNTPSSGGVKEQTCQDETR